MKITRYIHSCILAQTDDQTVLFDPGAMSYASKLLDFMWHEQWRADMYDRLEKYFASIGIRFIKIKDGSTVEL